MKVFRFSKHTSHYMPGFYREALCTEAIRSPAGFIMHYRLFAEESIHGHPEKEDNPADRS